MRTLSSIPAAFLMLLAVAPPPVRGQAGPPSVTLEEALARFQAGSPALALARSRVRAETAASVQSRAAPNPMANFSNETVGDYWERYLTLNQRIDFLWDAGGNRRRADARAEQARARFHADSARLVREVKEAYLQAWQQREEAAVLRRAEQAVASLLTAARARFGEGDLAGYDVRRLEVEQARMARLTAQAQVQEGLAEERLAALIGGAGAERVSAAPLTDLPPALPVGVDAVTLALQRRPEIAAARAAVLETQAEVGLARSSLLSGTSVGAGVKGQSDGREGLFLELQVPVPLLDRRSAATTAARAAVSGAESEVAWVERVVALEASLARARVGAARQMATLVADRGLPEAEELLAIARVAYEEGEVGIVEMLDATGAFVEAGLLGIGARVELWLATFELEQAVGGLLGNVDQGDER